MFRFPIIALIVALTVAQVPALADSFWLDGEGRVFTIDSYGRIAIDGSSTNWYPDRSNLDLVVTRSGDAVYTNSYGRLCRNGSELHYDWIRPHYFRVDQDGNIYTVHDWVGDKIQKNGVDTPYEIAKGSGFVIDPEGRLYYTSASTGNLCIDGQDTGRRFQRDDFKVGAGGLYYVNHYPNQQHRYWLYRFDVTTGAHQHVAWLATYRAFDLDTRGNLWFADFGWAIKKNGVPTGWRAPTIHLDGACNVYTKNSQDRIFRSGQDTGYVAKGVYEVAANGDVVYVADPSDRELYRNGQALGIHLGSKAPVPPSAPDAD
ncbi:MAG: hypothetical protein HY815_09520 [Candidatus Riflebacteria bacterium]|nr:hypothetical protein [Candidatus Riflebacteria bacterium]